MKDEVVRIYDVPKEKISIISSESDSLGKEFQKLYGKLAEAKKNET